jgi:hypothetical protein
MRKLAHIVTPVIVPESSDLFLAQPITLETMRMARRFAEQNGGPRVTLYSAHFAEGASLVPKDFVHTPFLDRSTLDLKEFKIPLQLPLIADILSRLYAAAADADYLIYTNVDIGLLPNFYVTVDRLIERGYDAFTINPRWIPAHYCELADIPIMWAEGDKFRKGWDCFVFRREAFPRFILEDVCLGVVNIGRALILNLVMTARNFAEFTDLHLTFHIGNDGGWKRSAMGDYAAHNLAVVRQLLDSLKSRNNLSIHPVVTKMIEKMKANGQLADDY